MGKNDVEQETFKKHLKKGLETELSSIHFSSAARETVKKKIAEIELSPHPVGRIKRSVAFPLSVAVFCLILFLGVAAVYLKTFFYATPGEIARFEQRQELFLVHDGNAPFGAMHHLIALAREREKETGRP